MSNWLVIRGGKIVAGPFGWDAFRLNTILLKLGYNVSFPVTEPQFETPIVFGKDDVKVVPMETSVPELSVGMIQNPVPVVEVLKDKVLYTYSAREMTEEELHPLPPPTTPEEKLADERREEYATLKADIEASKSLEDVLVKVQDLYRLVDVLLSVESVEDPSVTLDKIGEKPVT